MEEWKEYKLGDVCKMIPGFAFKSNEFGKGSNVAIKIKDIQPPYVETKGADNVDISRYDLDKLSKFIVHKGEFLLAMTGATIGKIGKYIDERPAYINQRVLKFQDTGFISYDYLYYYLSTNIFQSFILNHIDSQSAQPNISSNTIGKYPIKVPSFNTQQKIASILKSLDDKIEVNRRINENLEQQAQALFKSWFVDFEPFKDGEFVESELGMIPKGWRVGTFLENIKVMPGGTPSTSKNEYWDGGTIPFFSPKDVNGVYCFETEKHITELGLNNCSSHLYPPNTLFITARGTVGKLALAGVPMAMNQSNYALVAKEGTSKFYLFLLAQTLVSILLKKANGAVFSAITTRDFNEPTIIPTNSVMDKFDKLISPLFNKIYKTSCESRRLAELRDTLLPKLMSGELKVNEIKA